MFRCERGREHIQHIIILVTAMNETSTDILLGKRWAILDIEYIQISAIHQCIRRLYILCDNGFTDMEADLYPCAQFKDLEKQYQRAFHYCQKYIHKLDYKPKQYAVEYPKMKSTH